MTNDLVQFLRDRYDEDETLAQNTGQWSTSWQDLTMDGELRDDVNAGTVAYIPHEATRTHIARHDPARVLAEVEAKRQITECHESWVAGNGDTICGRCGREHIDGRPGGHFPCQTLRLLALPYADHPDYRSDWAPDQA